MALTCQPPPVEMQGLRLMSVNLAAMAPSKRAGATSNAVASNLLVLRGSTGMSLRQLSAELAERGVSITAQSLSAIEKGDTAVTVDLLTALAAVFGVSPVRLLMPAAEDSFEPSVALTGTESVLPVDIWEWLTASRPLGEPFLIAAQNPGTVMRFRQRSRPSWLREKE